MDSSNHGQHIVELLEESKRFTTELLEENEQLRLSNVRLKTRATELEKQVGAGGLDELRGRLEAAQKARCEIEAELNELKSLLTSVEEENRDFARRHVRIERQNANLASLYVASYNLHATLEFSEVLEYIKEIVISLLGSECFGVYVASEETSQLELVAHEGLDDKQGSALELTDEMRRALVAGEVVIDGEQLGNGRTPLAFVPLVVNEEPLGVLVIYELLSHKASLEPSDHELLDLMAGQAATALYSARLFAQSKRKLGTLQGFMDLLRAPQ